MNWTIFILVVVVLAALFAWQRGSLVSAELARQHLAAGALVIDVRSSAEFRSGPVPGAINIPLGELRERITRHAQDKQQPILVHCLSGGRSAIAQKQLQGLGYTKAFNLGSVGRAQAILTGSPPLR